MRIAIEVRADLIVDLVGEIFHLCEDSRLLDLNIEIGSIWTSRVWTIPVTLTEGYLM